MGREVDEGISPSCRPYSNTPHTREISKIEVDTGMTQSKIEVETGMAEIKMEV